MYYSLVDELFKLAILEDIGHGDITSEIVVPKDCVAFAEIICKENLVLAGIPFIKRFFTILSSYFNIQNGILSFDEYYSDGSFVEKGSIIAVLKGNARILLAGERIALNLLQRLSGIATFTKEFVERIKDLRVKILDTRKTSPGLRFMEKYAVRVGGGYNHRFALYDAVLIKDNHIKIAGSVKEAVLKAKSSYGYHKIEVEVKSIEELEEAIMAGADIVMLDNMDIEEMKKAVKIAKGRVLLEASGGVNLENVRQIALTGVDFISIGALTHSAKAVDISMKIKEVL
ncbi:nicotinate-nucleotide pyrophosphorylase [Thermodesulfovibrio aggregans]|uniref:Probable nicotinate-nucleotide pyrophosphorylase [carboxylating] n=1 Tax=Thermodesulfovibrio aggregans TaxID=86166 RepID=A0A0U9HY93_9BACT|nr:carboxylating nicotinate-nucleotide diphosphorylase [Thermodesulfovibrio aggregans]GAQ94981.1 nicotinate-nucleotide pyrophosphorylase [Thermodesulfovibrio aggregans]